MSVRSWIAAMLATLAVTAIGCDDDGGTETVTETVEVPVEPDTTRPSARPATPPPRSLPLERHVGSLITSRVPQSWTLEADEEQKSGFVETRWRDPADPSSYLLIDVIDGETLTPAQKAESVRAATSATPGYRELSFDPITLAGDDAFRWEFEVSGDRRIDFFLNDCGVGVAVLGSTAPAKFRSLRRTFTSVARSVRVRCGAGTPPPAAPPPPVPDEPEADGCLPEYPDICVPDDGFDYDCPEVDGTDFSVPGDDPMGFDRDGDGVGCES